LGANVKGYALPPDYEESFFSMMSPNLSFENVFGDIRHKFILQKELETFMPDFIFHFSAQALVRKSYQIPSETFEINTLGTANLLEAVRHIPGKCTVIIITTDKVYQNKELEYRYNENDTLGGYDPYSASKAAVELVVDSFRNSFFNLAHIKKHQKAISTARAGNVIGGGDQSQDRIIPDIVNGLRNNQPIEVRNLYAIRPWQHVLESLFGYLKLAIHLDAQPVLYSGAFNFGPIAEDHLPVVKLVEEAIRCWGKGTWVDASSTDHVHEANLLQLDITKSINTLNWKPKLRFKEAVQWTMDWYKQKPEDIVDFTFHQLIKYQAK
jgi:CDP-glucose 4,6-dehydratase